MKTRINKVAALVAVMLAGAGLARGETVTLAWDASVSTNVAGYRVYWGPNSRAYFGVTNAGLVLTQTVVLPHSRRWFFAATAYDTNGLESDFSNEVSWESKPTAPVMAGRPWMRLAPVFGRSTNLVTWGSVTGEAIWFPATNGAEFFRVKGLLMERVMVP
jgi:hypothetical protein